MSSVIQMQGKEVQQTAKVAKSNVVTGTKGPKKSGNSFKVVDLWNIQRNVKSANSLLRRRAI
ncbi:MAG: hypothetical protein ACHQET_04460 [Chitinophagales bacterium]